MYSKIWECYWKTDHSIHCYCVVISRNRFNVCRRYYEENNNDEIHPFEYIKEFIFYINNETIFFDILKETKKITNSLMFNKVTFWKLYIFIIQLNLTLFYFENNHQII